MKCLECPRKEEGNFCTIFGWIGHVRPSQCNDTIMEEINLLRQNIADNGYIQLDQLNRICQIYDIVHGEYVESEYQGASVYEWIAELLKS